MKIYTKKGDQGQTYLFGGGPYPKDSERIEAYGTVDELNSIVGCTLTELQEADLVAALEALQKELFQLGAELATLQPTPQMLKGYLQDSHIHKLEQQIDAWEKELKPLQKFILPGGAPAAAWLHLARTVCRRAERCLVSLSHDMPIRPELLRYLNRLSDWFFVMARLANHRARIGDVLWEGLS